MNTKKKSNDLRENLAKSVNLTHQCRCGFRASDLNCRIPAISSVGIRLAKRFKHSNMKRKFNRIRLFAIFMSIALTGHGGAFAQTVTFTTNDYSTGSNPFSVIAADVFGTGRPAIITANQADDTVTVLGNFGNGTFASNATYKVSSLPRALVAADFNGDGKLDLASIGVSATTILTNFNSGLFASNATLNVGGYAAIAFSLNGNSTSDLVIGSGGVVTVFTNNGSGTLGLNATLPVSGIVDSMVASDVNFDGKLDLLVANENAETNGSVMIFTNSGSGSLVSNATYFVEPQLRAIAVADVNGDDYPDFIAGSEFGSSSPLFIWTNNGSGVFSSNATVMVARGCLSIDAADFNGDGLTDLIAMDSADRPGIVSVVMNSSAGFGNYHTVVAGQEPQAMAMADFNGDQKPDIVLGNAGNSITVLLNSTLFAPPPLNIVSASGNQSVVYWKNPAPDSVLQATTNLVSPNWFTVTNGRPIQGITLSNAAPALFFRLISQ